MPVGPNRCSFDESNDGVDADSDGLCDVGDTNDDDNDDLSDADEPIAGAEPFDQDTDDDGLFDGAEVGSAVDACPDPLDSDFDGDTISVGTPDRKAGRCVSRSAEKPIQAKP